MKLSEIISLINGELLSPIEPDGIEIGGAMGADLMSDVLTSVQPEAVLLTGLCNPQVVRTAQIADIRAIVFVRSKNPAPETLVIANAEKIPLIKTAFGLYQACGVLYGAGLPNYELETHEDYAD
jgi:hypothetical protein